MRIRRAGERRRSRRAISFVLLVVCLCISGVLTGSGSFAEPSPGSVGGGLAAPAAVPHAPTPPGGPTAPRIAYTSDSDHLQTIRGEAPVVDAGALHEGELSNRSGGFSAFVSTTGDTGGEVYLNDSNTSGGLGTVPITCDGAIHTHPAVLSGNQFDLPGVTLANNVDNVVLVAYGVQSATGTTRIDIAVIDTNLIAAGTPLTCTSPALTTVTLGAQVPSNFWPTWGPSRGPAGGGSGNSTPTLIYTSTRDNPLGDLYYQPFGSGTATRLTNGGSFATPVVANTQPSYTGQGGALLFTTTRYRRDESLGTTVLQFATTGPAVVPTTTGVHSAWTTDPPPQSSAGVAGGNDFVLFASTAASPLGAVQTVLGPTFDAVNGVQLSTSSISPTTHSPFTPVRSAGDPAIGDGRDYTSDDLAAGIDDVLASDPGSTRSILAPTRLAGSTTVPTDVGAPSYSPDGTQLVYSQATGAEDLGGTTLPTRRLYVANADGTKAAPLDYPYDEQQDIDLSPSWSPDGTKIAFTRVHLLTPTQVDSSRVEYVNLAATPRTTTDVPVPNPDHYFDADPSWAPDSTRIVLTRQPEADLRADLLITPASTDANPLVAGTQVSVQLTIHNDGSARSVHTTATLTYPTTVFVGVPAFPAGCAATADTTTGVTTLTCTGNDIVGGGSQQFAFTGTTPARNDPTGTNNALGLEFTLDVDNDVTDSDMSDNEQKVTVHEQITHNAVGPKFVRPRAITPTAGVRGRVRPHVVPAAAPAPLPIDDPVAGGVRSQPGGPGDNPDRAVPTTSPQLWTVNISSGAAAGLRDNTALCQSQGCGYDGRTPAWSPDGLHIAYEHDGSLIDLNLLDTAGVGQADDPAVATGQTLVTGFTGYVSGQGGTPTASRTQIEAAYDPAWWPDGSALVFSGQPAGLPMQRGIYIVNADGAGLRTIVQGRGPETEPAVAPVADLGVTLTSTPTFPASAPTNPPGDNTDVYTFDSTTLTATVTDNGPGRVTAPTVTFTIPAGMRVQNPPAGCLPATAVVGPGTLVCTVGALVSGASVDVTIVATSDGTAGDRTFTADVASAIDTNKNNDTASTTVAVRPRANLGVTIAGNPQTAKTGKDITFTTTVTNDGQGGADGTVVIIKIPDGVDAPTDLKNGCSYAAAGRTITCNLGTIAAGASQAVTFLARSEIATAYQFEADVTTTTQQEGEGSRFSYGYVRWVSHAGLSVLIDAVPKTVTLGEQTTVTTTVTNTGPDTAGVPEPSGTFGSVGSAPPPVTPFATVTIQLPSGMSVPTPPTGCTIAGTTITCQLAPFTAGEVRTCTFVATGQLLGDHTYDAAVASNTGDDDPSDNTASTTVSVVRPLADLSVTITPSQPHVQPGDPFDAIVSVRNDGDYPAENSTLTTSIDPRLQPSASPTCAAGGTACPLGTLAAGDEVSFIVALVARHDGTPPADYSADLSATAATTSDELDTANNTATATVRVSERAFVADVAVAVTAPPVAYVGGPSTVTVRVSNLGPQPASDVQLTTTVPAPLDPVSFPLCITGANPCKLGTIAAGGSRTFTLRITPQRLKPARNYVTVIAAVVHTSTSESSTANNHDSARLPVRQPRVRLLPPVGTPGSVTLVYGEDLPPGRLVTVAWRTGITTYIGPYRVDPDGTFTAPMQLVRRDELGTRRLVATSVAGLFSPVGATMLVVPERASPPSFVGRG